MSRSETPTPDPYLEPEPGFGVDGLPLPQQPREAVTSAACELCAAAGASTAVEWQGGLNEQAITDMGDHLRDAHIHVGVQLNVRDDTWSFAKVVERGPDADRLSWWMDRFYDAREYAGYTVETDGDLTRDGVYEHDDPSADTMRAFLAELGVPAPADL